MGKKGKQSRIKESKKGITKEETGAKGEKANTGKPVPAPDPKKKANSKKKGSKK